MARLRTLILHSPGVSAIAAMIALVSVAWAAPEAKAHHGHIEQSATVA